MYLKDHRLPFLRILGKVRGECRTGDFVRRVTNDLTTE